jgi:hypothetical protein
MARITPASGTSLDLQVIEEHEPYKVSLKTVGTIDGSPQYGGKKRLQIDWEFEGGDNDTVRDWMGIAVGTSRTTGKVSKLRSLLNTITEKPENTVIEWFDDETFEWSYVKDGPAYAKLAPGLEIIIRGKFVDGKDASGAPVRRYAITTFQNPSALKKPKRTLATAADAVDDKEPPF